MTREIASLKSQWSVGRMKFLENFLLRPNGLKNKYDKLRSFINHMFNFQLICLTGTINNILLKKSTNFDQKTVLK